MDSRIDPPGERPPMGLGAERRGGQGQLVIGAIMGTAPDLVARAVVEVKRERPLLVVRIIEEASDPIGLMLERRDVELAIGRFTSPLQQDAFDFAPLSNEVMQVVVRSGHPLLRRRDATLASLLTWPWILQPPTSPARVLLEEEFAKLNASTPANLVECASLLTTLQLLQTSDAVAALPESLVRAPLRSRQLRVLPLSIGKDLQGFGVMTRKGEALSEAATAFVALLVRFADTM